MKPNFLVRTNYLNPFHRSLLIGTLLLTVPTIWALLSLSVSYTYLIILPFSLSIGSVLLFRAISKISDDLKDKGEVNRLIVEFAGLLSLSVSRAFPMAYFLAALITCRGLSIQDFLNVMGWFGWFYTLFPSGPLILLSVLGLWLMKKAEVPYNVLLKKALLAIVVLGFFSSVAAWLSACKSMEYIPSPKARFQR